MKRYISLLRGINVSGQKPVRMQELKALYESLGFEQVVTYVQSGNVVFDSLESDKLGVAGHIENGITHRFGFQVPVMLRDHLDFQGIIANNPFLQRKDIEVERLYVTFLTTAPAEEIQAVLGSLPKSSDEWRQVGTEIYLYCPGGYGRTVLSNKYFEKKLGQNATTRNWKTVVALSSIASRGLAAVY